MSPPVYPGGVESWPVPEELVGVLDVCPVKKNGFFLKNCLRNSINYPWPLRGGRGGGGWSVSEALQYFKSSPVQTVIEVIGVTSKQPIGPLAAYGDLHNTFCSRS